MRESVHTVLYGTAENHGLTSRARTSSYSVEVSLPDLTKIIRMADPLLKNPSNEPSKCSISYVSLPEKQSRVSRAKLELETKYIYCVFLRILTAFFINFFQLIITLILFRLLYRDGYELA
jgi:hypothetical protein